MQPPRAEVQPPQTQPTGSLDERYRSNVVKAAGLAGQGWDFKESPSPSIVDNQGRQVQGNEFWEIRDSVNADGSSRQVMGLRQGANAEAAVNDLFANKKNYQFDCAAAVRVLGLKAELDTVGGNDFNRAHQGLELYGHHDSYDGNFDSGAWNITAGPRVDYGAGAEFGAFDSSEDSLKAGDLRYFEKPGDTTTANQGWNAIYLGKDAQGGDRFWRTAGGEFSSLEGHYLSNLRGAPDLAQLGAVDVT